MIFFSLCAFTKVVKLYYCKNKNKEQIYKTNKILLVSQNYILY